MSFVPFLQTSNAAAGATGSQGMLMTVLPFVLIIAIFYFFIIRPQNKKQKETEKMINALKKGDKVVTIGGIHGVVASTKEKTVILRVDDNTKIEFNRSAIAGVVADRPSSDVSSKKGKKEELKNASDADAEKIESSASEAEKNE